MNDGKTHGAWEVTGTRTYRGHAPGTQFEAGIPTGAAARAVARGDVRLIEEFVPCPPDDYQLPEGWTNAP